MRNMKARQLGKQPKTAEPKPGKKRGPKPKAKPSGAGEDAREMPPELEEDESEEPIEAASLVDQGDGVRVARGRRSARDDEGSYECPDEEPPGYGGGL